MDLERLEVIHKVADPISGSITGTFRKSTAPGERGSRPDYKLTYHASHDMVSVECPGKVPLLILGNNITCLVPSEEGAKVLGLVWATQPKPQPKPAPVVTEQPKQTTQKKVRK